jgi:tripartite ATP-independent transporter DctP family solute receptor
MGRPYSRRAVVCGLVPAALTGFALAGSGIARAADTIHLKFGHADNERAVFHTGALKFKEAVEKHPEGKMVVDIYPNAQLGDVRDVFEGLQMGSVDLTASVSSVIANFVPNVAVYDLPCIIDDYQHAYRTLDGSVGQSLDETLLKNGVIPLGWWEIGFRNITSNKDINTVADIKGLRIRIMTSNIFRDMFLQLGADPVPMAWGELFTALQQKTVDAQENPYTQILDTNFYEVQKYLVETEHAYSPALFSMSAQTWGRLTPEQQKIIKDAAREATLAAREASETRATAAKKSLVEQHGMQLRRLDKADLQAKLRPVYAKYPQLADLVKQIDSYRKK